ncbi:MAG: TonB-dependent receptor, partial [Halioglobus sp.]|nr:TonB-dependent receptor [Halioglobus sp.]
LDATAFYTQSDNYIDHRACLAADNCPATRDRIYVNIGESRAYGVELFLGLQGAPWGLEPYANLTWMQRRNDYADFSTRETGIPDLSGRTGVRWQGARPALWADVYLRGESSSELEEPGTVRDVLADKDGWITLNIAAGLDLGRDSQYRLSLELQNLTDKHYIASTENLYGAERSAALKLTLDW